MPLETPPKDSGDSAYVVLARKWRPGQFADIVGQGPVVRTLMNAIRTQRIHQAYLMTGSRGIGKTSIARIFAKAVRCQERQDAGDWLVSCDTCSSCKEIRSTNSVDVIEIDGASNNGVDAIREIRENAKYLPSFGSRKIYIIDEVHMLTTAAFNALLKTLEEPPSHVIFIFATTEPHKIPATILSRCQRFDLRRVSMAQIQARLAEVTQAEKIHAEPAALAMIARAAEGSMRDALSVLDQVIAFSGSKITIESTRDSIGLIESQVILGVLRGVLERKPLESLSLVEQAFQQGHDLRVLTRSLIESLYATILAKVGAGDSQKTSKSLEFSDDEWAEISELSSLRELEELELIFQVLHHGMDWIARSPQPKLVLDVLLIKCATAEALVRVGDVTPAPAQPTGSGSGRAVASGAGQSLASSEAPQNFATPQAAPAQAARIAEALAPSSSKPTASSAEPQDSATTPSATPQATAPVTAAPRGEVSWESLIAHVRQQRPLLASILEHGTSELPGTLPAPDQDILRVFFNPDDAYYREQLQTRHYAEQLQALATEYFGKTTRIRVELGGAEAQGESLAAKRQREREEREQSARKAVQNHPIIQEARSLFGGDLGPIEVNMTDGKRSGGDGHA